MRDQVKPISNASRRVPLLAFLALALGLGLAMIAPVRAQPAGEEKKPALPAAYAATFQEPFNGPPKNADDFKLIGSDAARCVKFQPDGLRITMPAGSKNFTLAGVATLFGVAGDFEITARYEMFGENFVGLRVNLDRPVVKDAMNRPIGSKKAAVGRANMNTILSIVKNGRVEVDAPPDWPEGTPVRVELELNGHAEYDDEKPESPEEIEERIRRLEAIEPVMTPEEEAAWEAERRACKEINSRVETPTTSALRSYSREKTSARYGNHERLDE